jgi:hypothetical protein
VSLPEAEINRRRVIPAVLVDPYKTRHQDMILPGIDGVPFKGKSIPDIKEDDIDSKRPKQGRDVHVDVLDLSKEEDLDYYQDICQLVGNGYAEISFERETYDESIKSWRVFIRWILNYTYMPKA